MKKERRSKLLVIVALALTTIALTIGFAAFSTTLNISSNATVTPNESDFKVTVYGFKSTDAAIRFETDGTFDESDLSPTISYPSNTYHIISATNASIDNSTHTIGNIKVEMAQPEDSSLYFFVIKNEGKYDAYLDLSNYEYEESEYFSIKQGECQAGEGTSEELLNAACPYISSFVAITTSAGKELVAEDNIVTIPKNDYIILGYGIAYVETENRVDGPFSVSFPDEQLIFSTTK